VTTSKTIIRGRLPWPLTDIGTGRALTAPPPRVWRLHITPGESPEIIRARDIYELSLEVRASLERHGAGIPGWVHGTPWLRWMQRAMWGDGPAALEPWRLVEVCRACAGIGTDTDGATCQHCGGTGRP